MRRDLTHRHIELHCVWGIEIGQRKKAEQDDIDGVTGCLMGVLMFGVVAYFGFSALFGGDKSKEQIEVSTPQPAPSPEMLALRQCNRKVSREYGAMGYDVMRYAGTPKTAYQDGDGTWHASLSIPFKTADPITGKKTRTFWVNADCTVRANGVVTLKASDWAGQP